MNNLIKWIAGHKLVSLILGLLVIGFIEGSAQMMFSPVEPYHAPAVTPTVRSASDTAALDAQIKADDAAAAAEQAAFVASPAGHICKAHPSWQEDECKELADNQLWITNAAHPGMTYEMLVYLRGEADGTNVSDYGSGKQYQYCWDGYTPSCFYDRDDDGRMDAFN